jgi:hypothetical protein
MVLRFKTNPKHLHVVLVDPQNCIFLALQHNSSFEDNIVENLQGVLSLLAEDKKMQDFQSCSSSTTFVLNDDHDSRIYSQINVTED